MDRLTHPGCRLWAAVSDAKVPGSGQHLTSIESYLTRTSSLSSELSYPPTEQDHPMYGLVFLLPQNRTSNSPYRRWIWRQKVRVACLL